MFLPEGKGGIKIDSSLMLKEAPSVIGTGEWDNPQCKNFKNENGNGLDIGDIILVREGQIPLALCEVKGPGFTSEILQKKHIHENYREVSILSWYEGVDSFPQAQGTLQRLRDDKTDSWQFIDAWFQDTQNKIKMGNYIDLINYKKQIILQGPPGTGKTYTAKDIAYQLITGEVVDPINREEQIETLESSNQFNLIQFHPAYSYEDFVRGIIATSNGSQIEYETVNKVLGELASIALKNYKDSRKDSIELNKEQWVQENFDEFVDKLSEELDTNDGILSLSKSVNIISIEADAFRYSGSTWLSQPRMKFQDIVSLVINDIKERKDIKHFQGVSPLANSHATYFKAVLDKFYEFMDEKNVPKKKGTQVIPQNYVLLIDEINRANLPSVLGELVYALEYRGESIDTVYAIDGDSSIIIPPNLYIIGTMNTADRSVGHIDYAIRRRFAFVDILPSIDVIEPLNAKSLFKSVTELFSEKYLAPDFQPKEVQLGHSYFLAKNDDILRLKLNYEIKPILREYIKDGILLEEAGEVVEALTINE